MASAQQDDRRQVAKLWTETDFVAYYESRKV
jgi:hypothetical protein